MALETLSSVSSALSQLFMPEIARQFNNMAVTASLVPVKPGFGKNVAWDVEFTGATAQTVAEGSDVLTAEFTTNPPVPATLSWATYRSSFQLSENELAAAITSTGSPNALLDMFSERVFNAVTKLAQAVNVDLMTGTGTDGSSNPNIVGLWGGSTDATGTYAGINRGTFTEWAGNQLGNSGIARPLTLDLLYQADQQIFQACGEPATHIITSPGTYRKYAGLFESIRRVMTPGGAPALMQAGSPMPSNGIGISASSSPLGFNTMPIIRDRNFPTGKMIMANMNYAEIRYLPFVNPGDGLGFQQSTLTGTSGGSGPTGGPVNTVTSIPARIVLLAKTGDSIKATVKSVIQLAVRRPNAFCQVVDISEV